MTKPWLGAHTLSLLLSVSHTFEKEMVFSISNPEIKTGQSAPSVDPPVPINRYLP
jgi:hypothetical protein